MDLERAPVQTRAHGRQTADAGRLSQSFRHLPGKTHGEAFFALVLFDYPRGSRKTTEHDSYCRRGCSAGASFGCDGDVLEVTR